MSARIRSKKLIRALNFMQKVRKCIQIRSGHQKKIRFVENQKECPICAILRENTPFFLAATDAITCSAMLPRGQKIMQIPPGSQKIVFCEHSVRFSR